MPDAGKNAIITYSGDGSTTGFAVDFAFLDETHLEVRVDGSIQVLNVDYTVDTDLLGITFMVAPGVGTNNVVITRTTPHPSLYVSFAEGSAVRKSSLDDAFLQSIYYTEEVEDKT